MTGPELEQLSIQMERVREKSGIRFFSNSWKWTAYMLRRSSREDAMRAAWIDRDELDRNIKEDISIALEQMAIRIRQFGNNEEYVISALNDVISALNSWKSIREGNEVVKKDDRDAVRMRAIKVRQELGQTVEAFASHVGISPSHLSNLETGKLPYGLKALYNISVSTRTSLNWLLYGIGDQEISYADDSE